MNISVFIKRHPVWAYYILTFVISWGGILLVIGGPGGIPGTPMQFKRLLPFAIPLMLAGPIFAGILLTGLIYGKVGFRELFSRLIKWRVGARWYVLALLTAPLLMTAIFLALSLFYPEFLPGIFTKSDKMSLLRMGIAAGLAAGIFEELGWTGFAIPRLRQRFSVLTTGLVVGFLWGAWHVLINLWSSGDSAAALSLTLFLHSFIFSIGILPAYRVLMVWVYDRTGSLLVAMLMHASLTFSNVVFVPLATGVTLVAWSLVLAAALWVVVTVIAMVNRGQLMQHPFNS
jgi:membrane protease YdiL (CAAX protease family)